MREHLLRPLHTAIVLGLASTALAEHPATPTSRAAVYATQLGAVTSPAAPPPTATGSAAARPRHRAGSSWRIDERRARGSERRPERCLRRALRSRGTAEVDHADRRGDGADHPDPQRSAGWARAATRRCGSPSGTSSSTTASILITGRTYTSLGETNASGGSDVFVARLTRGGQLLWLRQIGVETAATIAPAPAQRAGGTPPAATGGAHPPGSRGRLLGHGGNQLRPLGAQLRGAVGLARALRRRRAPRRVPADRRGPGARARPRLERRLPQPDRHRPRPRRPDRVLDDRCLFGRGPLPRRKLAPVRLCGLAPLAAPRTHDLVDDRRHDRRRRRADLRHRLDPGSRVRPPVPVRRRGRVLRAGDRYLVLGDAPRRSARARARARRPDGERVAAGGSGFGATGWWWPVKPMEHSTKRARAAPTSSSCSSRPRAVRSKPSTSWERKRRRAPVGT